MRGTEGEREKERGRGKEKQMKFETYHTHEMRSYPKQNQQSPSLPSPPCAHSKFWLINHSYRFSWASVGSEALQPFDIARVSISFSESHKHNQHSAQKFLASKGTPNSSAWTKSNFKIQIGNKAFLISFFGNKGQFTQKGKNMSGGEGESSLCEMSP